MTFYFYDLETSGLNPRTGRIMQFAGQRTDADFNPIGDPLNCLVKLSEEVIPEPEAVMVHGVTPQKSIAEGYTEAEFLKVFNAEVLQPGTIILGFNSIRFDDEFMRYTLWRNFYDPYEWQWKDRRTRWDLIDAVRMTRALRPDGIEWPVDTKGKATNRLELITKANGISHEDAHDALSDVLATIDVAKLLHEKQPKIFSFLLENRGKRDVAKLLNLDDPTPVIHTSGMLDSEHEKTTAVIPICPDPNNPGAVLVYDLRHDPEQFADMTVDEIKELAFMNYRELKKSGKSRVPVKGIYLNKAPAVAPMGVLDKPTQERIHLTPEQVESNRAKLIKMKGFAQKIHDAYQDGRTFEDSGDPDQKLYDGFLPDSDKVFCQQVRNRDANKLADYHPDFSDSRLPELLIRYKARNFPESLTPAEEEKWKAYVSHRRSGGLKDALGLEKFGLRIHKLSQEPKLTTKKQFLLQELQLFGEGLL